MGVDEGELMLTSICKTALFLALQHVIHRPDDLSSGRDSPMAALEPSRE